MLCWYYLRLFSLILFYYSKGEIVTPAHKQNGDSSSDGGNSPTSSAIRKGWHSMTRSARLKTQNDFENMLDDIEIDKPKLLRERKVCLNRKKVFFTSTRQSGTINIQII